MSETMSTETLPPEAPPTRARRRTLPLFRMAAASAVALAAAVTLVTGTGTSAFATGGNVCPGGQLSGTSSDPASCPDIHNLDLLPQPEMPATVYRGDDRSPDQIFREGFTARGFNYDLQRHAHGGAAARDSGFVSTTGTLGVAEYFTEGQAQQVLMGVAIRRDCQAGVYRAWIWVPVVGRMIQNECENGDVTTHTYVYEIDTALARNAQYVPAQLGNVPGFSEILRQDEWAYDHWIPAFAIRGVRVYTATAHQTRGFLTSRPVLRFDRFIPNPNHRRPVREYDPGQDPGSHFTAHTYLNVPSQQANRYTRGCSAINQCREAGSGSGDHG